MFTWLRWLKDNVSWGFYGFLLAALFGLFAIYTAFFYEKKPAVTFEVLSSAGVLAVREDVEDLEILYRGSDITQSNQSLRVIVIRVQNTGSADIPKNYYDENEPLGVRLSSGEIVRTELLDASSEYLNDNVVISQPSPQRLTFAPVILDSEEYFIVKLLALHEQALLPRITPVGKVTGVREIEIRETLGEPQRSFITRAFEGSAFVQTARTVAYAVMAIVALILVVLPLAALSGWITTRKRKKVVRQVRQDIGRELEKPEEFLIDRYMRFGTPAIKMIARLVADPSEATLLRNVPAMSAAEVDSIVVHTHRGLMALPGGIMPQDLFEVGVLIKSDDQVHVHDGARQILNLLSEGGEL